jgi:cytohesin
LDEAAGWGRKDIVELLIAKGADVNAKFDEDGSTPLHLAAWKGHFDAAELLIAADADVNAKMDDGDTPLDLAKGHPEIADILRKHGGKTGEELKVEGK